MIAPRPMASESGPNTSSEAARDRVAADIIRLIASVDTP